MPMTYEVQIKRQARRKLLGMPADLRIKIAEKIYRLGLNPDDPTLDIKPLEGRPYFRLRIGEWRIIFDRQDIIKLISIEKIGTRGDVYK